MSSDDFVFSQLLTGFRNQISEIFFDTASEQASHGFEHERMLKELAITALHDLFDRLILNGMTAEQCADLICYTTNERLRSHQQDL